MARHLRLKHPKVYRQMHQHLETKKYSTISKISTSWVKGSWARRYCHRVGEKKYQCNVCSAVLRFPKGLYGNMKRHIRTKHPYVYEKEVNQQRSYVDVSTGDDENIVAEYLSDYEVESKDEESPEKENSNDERGSESDPESTEGKPFLYDSDPELETKVKYLVSKREIPGRKRARNCFWNFFNVVVENHRYACLACNRRVAIFPHSIANLKRHIKNKHKRQYNIIMKYLAENDGDSDKETPISFDKYYFDSEGDDYKCKECGTVINCSDEEQQALFDHIKDTHPDQILAYQEENVENIENEENSQSVAYNVVIIKKE
ncbi:uncharacterized protein LOC126370112 [Pectinophora gossypiella]|uniref:BED-type domain-containing protein n=2 Tax=Pectinophora gossypiella TaxID=13191 RepID=A0A1E1VYB9_PECGO|nr:uncharacterized protein LOC126370112 [Pectinophora gossypiella]